MMTFKSRILYYTDCKQRDAKRVVLLSQLQTADNGDYHSGIMAGYFFGSKAIQGTLQEMVLGRDAYVWRLFIA